MKVFSGFTPLNTAYPRSLPAQQANNTGYSYATSTKDRYEARFSGAGQSKPELDYDKAEEELHLILADSNVDKDLRKKATKKYEELKKESGKAKAIKDTCSWLFGVAGAGVPMIHGLDSTTANSIGMLLAVVGGRVGTAIATLVCKDENAETWLNRKIRASQEERYRKYAEEDRYGILGASPYI